MPMRMSFLHRTVVLMPVMLVVDVLVLMFHLRVEMLVLMSFGEVQPQACGHQDRRGSER